MLLKTNICNVYIVWQPCHFDSTTPTVEDALFNRRISIYKQKDGAFQNSTLSGSNCDESVQNTVNPDHSYCLSTNLKFTPKLENIHSRSYGTSEASDASRSSSSSDSSSTDSSGTDLSSADLSSTDSSCSTDSSGTNSSGTHSSGTHSSGTHSSDTDSSSTDSSGTDSSGTDSSSTGSSSTNSSSAVSSSSDIYSNIKNEPTSDIDSNIKNEPVSDIDSNIKNEPASDIDLNIKNEPDSDIDSNIKNEPASDSSQNTLEDFQVKSSCKHNTSAQKPNDISENHTCNLNSVESVEFVIKIARKIQSEGGTLCGSDIIQTIEKIRPRCVCIGRASTQAADKEREALHYAENYNQTYELLCSLIQRIFSELYSTVRIEENAKEDLSHEIMKHLLLILSYAMRISKKQNHRELTVRDFGEALKFGGFSVLWD